MFLQTLLSQLIHYLMVRLNHLQLPVDQVTQTEHITSSVWRWCKSRNCNRWIIVRITVSGNAIQDFGLTGGSDTTIHDGGSGYTFGNVSLTNVFSDITLTSSANMGSGTGGIVRVIISPKDGSTVTMICKRTGRGPLCNFKYNSGTSRG